MIPLPIDGSGLPPIPRRWADLYPHALSPALGAGQRGQQALALLDIEEVGPEPIDQPVEVDFTGVPAGWVFARGGQSVVVAPELRKGAVQHPCDVSAKHPKENPSTAPPDAPRTARPLRMGNCAGNPDRLSTGL